MMPDPTPAPPQELKEVVNHLPVEDYDEYTYMWSLYDVVKVYHDDSDDGEMMMEIDYPCDIKSEFKAKYMQLENEKPNDGWKC